ncbi:cyclic nucleotide-binding domain-containing protein [Thermodesulfobacteriota bacterium]
MKEDILQGNIKFLNLGDLMQLLGGNGSSGILRIMSPYAPEPGIIYFDNGNPINASCGMLSGLDALYSLFGWTDGEFEFTNTSVTSERVITKGRMGIILDGLKMLDEGRTERLGPVSMESRTAKYSDVGAALPVIWGPLVDYMYVVDEEEFHDGDAILQEGRHGNWVWVVLEGVIDIIKETASGPLTLYQIGNGSFVGSVSSFLVRNHSRMYSAKAVGDVQLGVLDSQRLAQEYSKMSYEFKAFVMSLDRRLRHVTDRVVEYSTKQIDLDDYLRYRQKVVEQGDDEKRLFRVQHGKASLVQKTDDGFVPLAHLERDDFFGYIPFLDLGHEPEFASVLASKDLKIQTLNPDILQQEYDNISTTFKNFIDNIATCTHSLTKVLNNRQKELMT